MAARQIYDEAGIVAIKNLWTELKSQRVMLDDTSFVSMLSTRVHPGVAKVPLRWDMDREKRTDVARCEERH